MGPAAWPLLIIMLLMQALSIVSVQVVSWTRAYAGGLAIWVAAESRAAYELDEYEEGGNEATYQRFRRELSVPLEMGRARVTLQSAQPDRTLARHSFLAGRIPADDVSGLINMFVYFRHHSLMMRAVDIWTQADGYVLEQARIGTELHEEYAKARTGSHPPRAARGAGRWRAGAHHAAGDRVRQYGGQGRAADRRPADGGDAVDRRRHGRRRRHHLPRARPARRACRAGVA